MSMSEGSTPRLGKLDPAQSASADKGLGRESFGELFDYSPMPMAVFYENYQPVAINKAFSELLGVPRETILTAPTLGYVHPDDRAAARSGIDLMFARADVSPTAVVRMFCAEGILRSIEVSTSVTFGSDGTKYLLVIFRDLSEELWNRGQ